MGKAEAQPQPESGRRIEMDKKKENHKTEAAEAILVVSFGTSFHDSRSRAIAAIEQEIQQAYPQQQVSRAFTSQMIINKLRTRDNIEIDNVPQALKRLAGQGVKRLIVQPTHLMAGLEYEKLLSQLKEEEGAFLEIGLGAPLLTEESDFEQVARAVAEEAGKLSGDTALVLMGHGTEAASNEVYSRMQHTFYSQGCKRYYVGTVEAEPDIYEIAEALKKDRDIKRVILMPLMVVAGDHAVNDMAGEEPDSWKSILEAEEYQVECILKGLGELPAIRRMYVEHVKMAY